MSVLIDLLRERKAWPSRHRAIAARHHHVMVVVEAALVVETCILAFVYQEAIMRSVQFLLK